MLSKKTADAIYVKMVMARKNKKDIARDVGYSYWMVVNVLNRKKSSKRLELLLKNWSDM